MHVTRGFALATSALVLFLQLFVGAGSSAFAQEFPIKPIRFIVPYSPGTAQDIIARVMAPEMTKTLGQPLVVETGPAPIR